MRLLVFADPSLASSMSLLVAIVKASAARADVELAGIVDTARTPPSPLRLPRVLAGWGLRHVCNLNTAAEPEHGPLLHSCASLARRRGIPVLAPHAAGVSDPSFVEAVTRLRPDASISLMVAQIFRGPLLAACRTPVNYHNGLLPRYQGWPPPAGASTRVRSARDSASIL